MISRNLAYLRRANGYSQEEVAEKIGVSRQAVAKWENGDSIPDLANSIALSELYRVTLDNLVKYEERASKLPIPEKGEAYIRKCDSGGTGANCNPKRPGRFFISGQGTAFWCWETKARNCHCKERRISKSSPRYIKKAGASDE